jgi:hypothetical protein
MTTPPTRKRTRALLLVIEFPRKVLVGNENKYGDENNEKGVAHRKKKKKKKKNTDLTCCTMRL